MTNGEKFKTAKERAIEFYRFCNSTFCADCVLMNQRTSEECRFAWLELEYKEEKEELKTCPFCGGTPVMASNIDAKKSLSYFVRCVCGARFASALSVSAAAEMWNGRVK